MYEVQPNGQARNVSEAERVVVRYLDRYPSLRIFEGRPDPGAAAHYAQIQDEIIIMPESHPEFQGSKANWWRTLFHELVHSTGHHSRKNRLRVAQGDEFSKNVEELTAELGSAFIMQELGMAADRTDLYLNHYFNEIGRNGNAGEFAARQAEEAVRLILGQEPQTVTVHAAAA